VANKNPTTASTDRVGKLMVYVAWILAALLLTWLFSGLLDRQRNPNMQVQSSIGAEDQREVILKRNRFGHYVASGEINGQDVVFLLDTGATVVSVPIAIARRLGLKSGARRTVETANGRISTYATILDSVKIGNIELNKVAASINPRSDSRQVLLGMTFLKYLEFMQRGDTLTIRQ